MADADAAAIGPARAELVVRVIVGVAAALAALAALAVGGAVLWAVVAVVGVIAAREWAELVGATGMRRTIGFAILAATLLCAAPMVWDTDRATVALLLILALLFMLVPGSTRMAWGLAYVGLAAIGLLFLREQPRGFALAAWTLAVVWATDVGAYFAGRKFGVAKLAPSISPNKTWVGLAGGVILAAIVGGAFGVLARLSITTSWLGGLLAVVAQGGDLLESWIKRRAGVKDSGMLLPGHGGLLDRIDGLLPVVILVAALVANGGF